MADARNWLVRIPCAVSLVLGFPLAGCGDDTDATLSPAESEADSALAVANEIVTGLVKSYADRRYYGKARAYAVDLGSFYGPPLFGGGSRIPDLALEEGLRRVAETLPPERAVWILRLHPVRADEGSSGVFVIHAQIIDLQAEHCCRMEAVALARDGDSWRVQEFFFGGFATETSEGRQKRLARAKHVPR